MNPFRFRIQSINTLTKPVNYVVRTNHNITYIQKRKSCQNHIHHIHTIKYGIIIFMKTQVALIPLLGYEPNIQSDWNINAAEFKNFYPLTHQGSHTFYKNRRKGKRNLPLVDRFVKPLNSASWFIRIFKGAV